MPDCLNKLKTNVKFIVGGGRFFMWLFKKKMIRLIII